MTVSHPDPGEYERFLRGELSNGENRQIVRQLLTAWRTCRGQLEQIWEGHPLPALFASWPKGGCDYGPAFKSLLPTLSERAWAVSRERQRLPELIARLQAWPPRERKELPRRHEEFRSWLL